MGKMLQRDDLMTLPKKGFCKLLLNVPEPEIFYLSAIIDGYDNLGYIRKEDAPQDHVWIYFSLDMVSYVYEVLTLLKSEIGDLETVGELILMEE